MNKTINILIADSHPIILDTVNMASNKLTRHLKGCNLNIHSAYDCESAFKMINDSRRNNIAIDLVIIDIDLKPYIRNNICSGEDICLIVKQFFHHAKIMVFTSLNNTHMLSNVFNSLNPEGFLLKQDTNYTKLCNALKDILSGYTAYSKTMLDVIRKQTSKNVLIDPIDRKILYYLSLGTKMKDLPNKVNLSLAAIERRKRHLRDIFNSGKKNDIVLIEHAKAQGFI